MANPASQSVVRARPSLASEKLRGTRACPPTDAPVPHLLCRIKFILSSHGWSDVTSLDHLPRVNKRREVEADDIHLLFGAIGVLDHGANDSILDFSVVQVHADFVADAELSVVRSLWGWDAMECTPAAE